MQLPPAAPWTAAWAGAAAAQLSATAGTDGYALSSPPRRDHRVDYCPQQALQITIL